jgi:hypothetical protein
MKVQAVGVCGNDGGGGDCEADGREATGTESTGRGGHVTQERNSVSDYVLLEIFWGTDKSFRCVMETPSEPKDDYKFDM